jgi:hypothetical protein
MATAELKVRIEAQIEQLEKKLKEANNKLENFSNKGSKSLGGFASNASSVMGLVGKSIAGAFSVGAVIGFTKQVFNATAQFQKFEAVLGNTLGSSALAGLKLKEIQEFAAKTPFGVNELTNAFVKLAGAGFKPTGDEMRKLGDLASSTGKSFNQLSEAIIDAQVGEFERLKEFNIRAQDAGDKVIFTFKGVQTQVEKSSSAIREYITALGDTQGVSGASAIIAETLGGKINNLGDSWDQMLISIGGNTKGVFSSAISIVGKAIDEITGFNRRLELVSKFKLKEDFGLNFQGGKIKISDVKGEVAQVEAAQKSVQNYIKSIQEIAKTPEEFKSAIKSLIEINREQITGLNNNNVAKAITAQFQEGVNQLNALSKEAAKIKPPDANFGKGVGKELKTTSDILKALSVNFKQIGADFSITFGKGNQERVGALKKAINELISIGADSSIIQKLQSQLLSIDPSKITEKGKEVGVNAAVGIEQGLASQGEVLATTIGENLKLGLTDWQTYVNNDLLPKVQTNFETFFNDILMRGKLSFESLGKAILNTFLSIAASDAARGLTNLLRVNTGAEFTATKGKGGGLLGGVIGLLGIGGKAAAGGGTAAVATGTAATGGALLPILAGVAAVAGIATLFKKKQPTQPTPAFTTSNAISTASSSNVDFGSGRVVFEISGVNLVGVLNRAGAKLQRFGP